MIKNKTFLRIIRFIISGAIATSTTIGVLYVLTDLFGLWYLTASVVAFLAGFCVSFSLQKFWTFQDRGTETIRTQATMYFGIVFVNLLLNTALIYIFVEYMHLYPVWAQICASGLIAIESFFAYRFFVFTDVYSQHEIEKS